jgi:pSer/pThr/pTyr-binding forkhead associated (FHA) protein
LLMLNMKENPSTASDDVLSQLLFESQVTVRRLDFSAYEVLERIRKFGALYQTLDEKPEGAALLYQEQGSSSVACHPVSDKLLVGRLSKSERNPAGCDLPVRDAEMSRMHFELRCNDGMYLLRDLHSRNGTSVNGAPRIDREVILKAGDTILAGSTIFVFTGA